MPRRITLIDGHPDPDRARLCHALAEAYATAAEKAGHEVRRVTVADLDFSLLTRRDAWETEPAPERLAAVQDDIAWAEHLVIIYPLWLGSMPARLKALLEQVFRPGFAFGQRERTIGSGRLKGRTARIIVTMGMSAMAYRGFYRSHSLKSFKRNILIFSGIGPIHQTLIGNAERMDEKHCRRWLEWVEGIGARGE